MRLKKIVIHGFKSFADRITIEFSEGITAIVGPNGCGKSNISDAFRWVLGEQSAKSLRGSKMHDILFAGTSTRQQMNFAEVTLVFTDVGEALPIEFDEVSVTRRLHRSGESEYLINRNPVRLRDVQGLFLDSGIGKNSFSIFEQGKIDQVINLSPMDRRAIFEEAAGILRFLMNKRKAMQKLKQTDDNVERVSDIFGEVEQQLDLLAKQAEDARGYKQNQADLAKLEKQVFLGRWETAQQQGTEIGQTDAEYKEELQQKDSALKNLEERLTAGKTALEDAEQEFQKRSEAIYQVKSTQEVTSKEQQTNEERKEEATRRTVKIQKELEELRQKRAVSRDLFTKNKNREKEVGDEFSGAEALLKQVKKGVDDSEHRLHALRDQQSRAQKNRLEAVQEESRTQHECQKIQLQLENMESRLSHVTLENTHVKSQYQEVKEKLSKQQEVLDKETAHVEKQQQIHHSFEQQLEELTHQIATQEEELEKRVRTFTEQSARYKALKQLQEQMEGFSEGTKRLLKESQKKGSPLEGMLKGLFEMITPQQGSEASLAMIMRPYAETLVVETHADKEKVFTFAQENGLNDFSLFCLESCTDTSSPSGRSFAECVNSSTLAAHFLKRIAMTSHHFTNPAITDEGVYIDDNFVFFYPVKGENSAFYREAELKSLAKSLKEQEVVCEALEKKISAARERRKITQEELHAVDQVVRKAEMKVVEVNFALQQLKGEHSNLEKRHAALSKEDGELKQVIEADREKLESEKRAHLEAKKQVEKIAQQHSTLDEDIEHLAGDLQKKRRELEEKQSLFQKASDDKQKLEHMLELFESKERDSAEQEERLTEELSTQKEFLAEMKMREKDVLSTMGGVKEELKIAIEQGKKAEENVAEVKKLIEGLEKGKDHALKEIKALEEKSHQMGVKAAHVQTMTENIVKALEEKYRLTIDEVREREGALSVPLPDAEKEVRRIRKKIDDAGNINLASIDEYEKQKARHHFLGSQIGDLEQSREELLKIIEELDNESRKMFQETFDQVRENFRKNFSILFTGGEADLTFTETDDILEAGIEIVAKPPGKQMRSIHLLSGGEKCLTAMALLFAIFEVKSAPFCILDEIDAPLDDTNISRFVSMVQQFDDKSQFIIITHNKRTMAIADRIFGVSMQERGVSRILSLEFAHKEEKEHSEEPLIATL